MIIRKIRDADYSGRDPEFALLEIISEKSFHPNEINDKLTLERGFRARLSILEVGDIDTKFRYVFEVVPQLFVPRESWEDATNYLLAHLHEVL